MHIDDLLHAQRHARLEMVPPHDGVVLSAGCAGQWYLDWIEETVGPISRHIGLEYYVPAPANLPANVDWIANTVGDMSDVASDSVDLVISGQNVEHLWVDDMVGFFCEANRVLRQGGRLVMDSPNREMTALLNWSHPEHTIELTPSEAEQVLDLAGFTVERMVGVHLTRDGSGLLPLSEPDLTNIPRRVLIAEERPEDSFCWWSESLRERAPDRAGLEVLLTDIFERAWPERCQRLIVGDAAEVDDGTGDLVVKADHHGVVMFGPYQPLPAGSFRATWSITGIDSSSESVGYCDLMIGDDVVAQVDIGPLEAERTVRRSIDFELQDMTFGIQFRMISHGAGARFSTPRQVDQERLDA